MKSIITFLLILTIHLQGGNLFANSSAKVLEVNTQSFQKAQTGAKVNSLNSFLHEANKSLSPSSDLLLIIEEDEDVEFSRKYISQASTLPTISFTHTSGYLYYNPTDSCSIYYNPICNSDCKYILQRALRI